MNSPHATITRKWPLERPFTPENALAKCDELLAREGEWTQWEYAAITYIRDHIPEFVSAAEDIYTGQDPVKYRDHALKFLRENESKIDDVYHLHYDMTESDREEHLASAISSAAFIAICIINSITYAPFNWVDYEPDDHYIEEIIYEIIRDHCSLYKFKTDEESFAELLYLQRLRKEYETPAELLEMAEERDRILENHEKLPDDFDYLDAIEYVSTSRMKELIAADAYNRNALKLRIKNSSSRNINLIRKIIEDACEEYKVPSALKPHYIKKDNTTYSIRWYPGTAVKRGQVCALRPNGNKSIDVRGNALGEISPYSQADIRAFMERTMTIIGRDYEIDAHGVPLSNPPIWCYATSLPLVKLFKNNEIEFTNDDNECGILSIYQHDLSMDGTTEISYDPLVEGLYIDTNLPVPEVMAIQIRKYEGKPLNSLIRHYCFDDERITIHKIIKKENNAYRIYVDAPVVRISEWPEQLEIIENPVLAWKTYAANMDAISFYQRMNKETDGGFITWPIDEINPEYETDYSRMKNR